MISISHLNDFIFCPMSIYFHGLYGGTSKMLYQNKPQIEGTNAHKTIDTKIYSSKSVIYQSIDIYCEKFSLYGKIDTFDIAKGHIVERKKKVKKIFDGYVFQVYAHYYCLEEMGYKVSQIYIHSLDDNKRYSIKMPYEDERMNEKFISVIDSMNSFQIDDFIPENINKCKNCIYEPLCDRSLC